MSCMNGFENRLTENIWISGTSLQASKTCVMDLKGDIINEWNDWEIILYINVSKRV